MKTIEQKANAYDEALEKARKYYESEGARVGMTPIDLVDIFPELAEKSLGERIKEVLIDYFKRMMQLEESFYGIPIYEVLAWLEKQGGSSIHYWTEEEIEPIISDYLRGAEHYGGMIGRLRCLKPKSFEKQGEVKSKTEAQFKKGDWVISRTGDIIMQIVDTKGFYESVEISGQRRTDTYNYLEWDFRLWDIKDAKDGDVLISKDEVFIYDHRKQLYPIAVAHCFVDSDGGFYLDGEFGYSKEEGHSIHPATKEQRDLLFQKMHEAGYEWNADAKKPEKVEQKPADTEIMTLEDAIEHCQEKACGNSKCSKEHLQLAEWLTELKELKQVSCVKKLAWTEDDESMLECALDMVKWYIGRNETKCRSVSNWLKSLKGRIGGGI